MSKVTEPEIHLIGIKLKTKTYNANGQAGIDCTNVWREFTAGNYAATIPNKLSEEIFAVYYAYEGDHTKPYSYFLGCKVKPGTVIPQGLDGLTIPAGSYEKISSAGKMPDCIVQTWKNIWASGMARAYKFDFELYDERSKDWNNAEVDVYLSL